MCFWLWTCTIWVAHTHKHNYIFLLASRPEPLGWTSGFVWCFHFFKIIIKLFFMDFFFFEQYIIFINRSIITYAGVGNSIYFHVKKRERYFEEMLTWKNLQNWPVTVKKKKKGKGKNPTQRGSQIQVSFPAAGCSQYLILCTLSPPLLTWPNPQILSRLSIHLCACSFPHSLYLTVIV